MQSKVLDGILSPSGALNNIGRWAKNLTLAFLARALITFAFAPQQTIDHFEEKGLKVFNQEAFDEQFAIALISEWMADSAFSILGFAIFGYIGRLTNNNFGFAQSQIGRRKKRSETIDSKLH